MNFAKNLDIFQPGLRLANTPTKFLYWLVTDIVSLRCLPYCSSVRMDTGGIRGHSQAMKLRNPKVAPKARVGTRVKARKFNVTKSDRRFEPANQK